MDETYRNITKINGYCGRNKLGWVINYQNQHYSLSIYPLGDPARSKFFSATYEADYLDDLAERASQDLLRKEIQI